MHRFLRTTCVWAACLAACLTSTGVAFTQALPLSPPAKTAANAPVDPLGRTTPSGTMLGFLQAAQAGDYGIAAQFLQMSPVRRQSEGEQMATKLKVVLDRAFSGRFNNFTQAEGIPQEGVPLGRQKLGTMSSGDVEADLELVRVSDPNAGKIWLISSETLFKIPELYDQVQARQVESRLPKVLVKHDFAGMPLWQFLALLTRIAGGGGARMAGAGAAGNSPALVGKAARRSGGRELALGLWSSLAAGRHSGSSVLRLLPSYSAVVAALLFSNHFDRADHQRDLDSVARRSMVPATRSQSRPGARARRHGIAHAAGRAHHQGSYFCGRRSSRAGQPGLQHEHRVGRTRHWRPGHRLRRAENHRESFRRSLCSRR